MKFLLAILILAYNLVILAGTAYLVQEHHWSPWWFLFTLICLMTIDLKEK